jgi:hypothetical protein
MNKGKSQFESIAEELADLLRWDPKVIKAYTFLLSKQGEVMREDMVEGLSLQECDLDGLLSDMDDSGLIVRGPSGYYPVHPRFGISNVFRLSCAKDPSVRLKRQKVDALMSILASHRDRLEERQFAQRRDPFQPSNGSTND